jgi:hypothetical protein
MSKVDLGPWEPDSAGVNSLDANGAVTLQTASNVYPLKIGYGPVPSLSQLSTATLPGQCRGLAFARATSGGYSIFAGTQTNLYKYDTSSSAWVSYTRTSGGPYNVSTDDYWSFAQFGSKLIAVNVNDDPQVIDVDTGATSFSALGGTPPRARYVTVIGDFVILGCLSTNNRKLRNSGINDATSWTVGVSLCDEQEFPDGGRITGIAGGEFGWVLQEKAIRRMDFHAGQDIAFTFERLEREHGAAAGYSVVHTINDVFFLSDDGFYAFGQNGLVPIGAQRVNKWFNANSDTNRFFSAVGFVDPYGPRIGWAFFATSGSTTFDRVLVYDWQLDRWSSIDQAAQFWATTAAPGATLEGLNVYGSIDTGVPYSLDSRVWEGGRPVIGTIDTSGRLAFLEGSLPLAATLTTAPMQLAAGGLSNVAAVEPLGVWNGANIAVRVGRRLKTQDPVSYTASLTPSASSGVARTKAAGRFHQVELTVSQASGPLWKYAQALDITATPTGKH